MARILRAGAVAGGLGGAALALVLRLVGDAPLRQAIAIERAATGAVAGDELFSRSTQQAGGTIGAIVFGVCAGLVFATVFAIGRRRIPLAEAWRWSLAMAATAFVTVALVPALKYPPNPPGVGAPDSVGRRTALYLVMIAWSLVSTVAARRLWLVASRRWAASVAAPLVAAAYVALVGAGMVLLPGTGEPVALPATLVWRFRVASIGGTAAMWTVTGFAFGALLERHAGRPARSPLDPLGASRA